MSLFGGTAQLNYDRQDGAPLTPSYVVIGLDGTLTNERVLTGTTNQVTITDNGAGSTVVVSLPQDIHAGASPSFTGLTLSGLTATRIPYVSTGGLLADDSSLIWDATNDKLYLQPVADAYPGSDPSVIQVVRTITTPPNTPPGAVNPLVGISGTFAQSGAVNQGRIGLGVTVADDASVVDKTVSNATNSGGTILIETSTAHGWASNDRINVYGVGGVTNANGVWTITVVSPTTFTLNGSTFAGAYTSGGTATNRGLFYAAHFNVSPSISRAYTTGGPTGTGVNGDDVAVIAVVNSGPAAATDGIWITDGVSSGVAFHTLLSSDSNANHFLKFNGTSYLVGLDFSDASTDSGTPMMRFGPGHNVQLDTVTGTKIGTSTSQKLGFFNATPVVQNTSTTDLRTGLINLGFFASGGASPLNLNGGALTAGSASITAGRVFVSNNSSVTSAVGTNVLEAHETNSTNATFALYSYAANSAVSMYRANTSAAAPSVPVSGNSLGANTWGGWDGSGWVNAARLRGIANETWSGSARGGYFDFSTVAAGTTTLTVRALVSATGLTIGSALAARGTTEPTNAINIFNGTAPSGALTNGVTLYSDTGKLKSADAAGTIGHVLSVSAVNTVSPTAPNRTLTVDIGGTTYYITAKTTND